MASGDRTKKKTPETGRRSRPRGRVPVTSRDREPEARKAKKPKPKPRLGFGEAAVVVVAAAIILGAVVQPLKNYVEGRTEISRSTQAIAEKERRVEDLSAQAQRLDSPAYQRELARRRLGVIGEGETPYRILDPEMTTAPEDGVAQEPREERGWLDHLWDSLSAGAGDPAGAAQDPINGGDLDTHLPLNKLPEGQ